VAEGSLLSATDTDALVIGSGPAGLAVAACLQRRGIACEILERAGAVGARWRLHYHRLHLHTTAAHSALPYLAFPRGTPRYPARDQVIAYLEQYARHFQLAPRFCQDVQRVQTRDGVWEAVTPTCTYRSRHMVIATGYAAVPNIPDWPGLARFRGSILHSSEYRLAERFQNQDVLVVGLGNSGGEIAIDLFEHGARVAVAVRGSVNIVPRDIFGVPVLSLAIALSPLPSALADALAAPLIRLALGNTERLGLRPAQIGPVQQIRTRGQIPLVDIGTVDLIRRGHVQLLGGIRELTADAVVFDDGRPRRFDALVLATGFRPGLERFLEPGVSASAPGLHFCGFKVTPIGMFREIGIEAERIASRVALERSE
jgi:indole-3-pyruvate monooxygenase